MSEIFAIFPGSSFLERKHNSHGRIWVLKRKCILVGSQHLEFFIDFFYKLSKNHITDFIGLKMDGVFNKGQRECIIIGEKAYFIHWNAREKIVCIEKGKHRINNWPLRTPLLKKLLKIWHIVCKLSTNINFCYFYELFSSLRVGRGCRRISTMLV